MGEGVGPLRRRRQPTVLRLPLGGSFTCCHGPVRTPRLWLLALARPLALGSCRRRRSVSEAHEPEAGGWEGAPRLTRSARPSCPRQVRLEPCSHLGNLGLRRGARLWHLRGRRVEVAAEGRGRGVRAAGGGERPWLPDQGEEEEEVSPRDPLGSCLSSCFSSHPERSSQKGARAEGGPAFFRR